MSAKFSLLSRMTVLCLAALAGGCEAPQPGAKPLFPNLFEPQPKPAATAKHNNIPPAGNNSGRGVKASAPVEVDVTSVPTRDDITAVYQYYTQAQQWLRNTDGRVIGFSSAVYFGSGETGKGAFVPGKALVWLWEIVTQNGAHERKLVNVWELNEQDAMGFRVRRLSPLGYGYGFFFTWPQTADLDGKTIEIMFGYERLDGKVITGAARRFMVPAAAFASPLSSQPGPTPAALPRAKPAAAPPAPQTEPPPRPEAQPTLEINGMIPAERRR
jgi:hypothetical protein